MVEAGHKKIFINAVARKGQEDIKIKIFMFNCIALAKFQSVLGALHHLTLIDNYQRLYSNVFALLILRMVYYLSVLCSVWGMRFVAVILVAFDVYDNF